MKQTNDMPFLIIGLLLGGMIGYLIGVKAGRPHPEYFTTKTKIKGILTEKQNLN